MPRPRADERARRLIAILGVLEPDAVISLTDLAEQLGVSPAEIGADLVTLSMCGIAPYDPSALVPLLIEGDVVEVFGEVPAIRGPSRLSAAEAGALLAALQAAGFSAEDPLARRILDASAASFDATQIEHVVRAAAVPHDASVYEHLARALKERTVVRIAYEKPGEATATSRDVEPVVLFAERGVWYLTGWCRLARGWRTFRVDRVRSASLTGERLSAERAASPASARAFDPAGLPTARLRFETASDFTQRDWPGAVLVSDEGGAAVVDAPFGGTAWIARRVVARLGSVEVLAPDEVRDAVAALASEVRATLPSA